MSFFGIGLNRSFEDMILYYKMTGIVDIRLMPSWMLTEQSPLSYLSTADPLSYLRRNNSIKSDTLGMKPRHELVNNCTCVSCSHELSAQKNLVVNILKILDEDEIIVPGNENEIYVNDKSPVDYNQYKILIDKDQNISTREHKKWWKWCDDGLKKEYWKKFDVKLTVRTPNPKARTSFAFRDRELEHRPEKKSQIKIEQKTETESEFEFDSEFGSLSETISDPESETKCNTKFEKKFEISSDSQFESKSNSSNSSSEMIQR